MLSAEKSKIARRGEKHICKSKCAKHHNLGLILEVPMFKNGTRLWREAHLQVKMYKTWTLLRSDVEKLYAAVAKSTFASQNGCPQKIFHVKGTHDETEWSRSSNGNSGPSVAFSAQAFI